MHTELAKLGSETLGLRALCRVRRVLRPVQQEPHGLGAPAADCGEQDVGAHWAQFARGACRGQTQTGYQ